MTAHAPDPVLVDRMFAHIVRAEGRGGITPAALANQIIDEGPEAIAAAVRAIEQYRVILDARAQGAPN